MVIPSEIRDVLRLLQVLQEVPVVRLLLEFIAVACCSVFCWKNPENLQEPFSFPLESGCKLPLTFDALAKSNGLFFFR